MAMRRKDLSGLVFGKLRVIEYAGIRRTGKQVKARWKCLCECGNVCISDAQNLSRGGAKTCGCSHRRGHKDSPNWKGVGDLSGSFYSQIRNNARVRNIPITVSKEYLLQIFHDQGGRCALSGIPIKLSYEKRRSLKYSNTASLDRKNSDLPYQDGNVQWLHKDVNIMKNHYAQDYFISMCASISKLASLP